MFLYKTVGERGIGNQIIQGSKFISYCKCVSTREEAEEFISSIRKKHKDATHNVPAFVIGDKMQFQWASDDGEPQGTSGAPMVQSLVSMGITNVVIVVTRYFGGTKLGTGGLVRAYTSSLKLAVEDAGVYQVCRLKSSRVKVDYTAFNKIKSYFQKENKELEGIEYTSEVSFSIVGEDEELENYKATISNLSGGKALFTGEEEVIVKNRCQ